jgi:hypothetical protein
MVPVQEGSATADDKAFDGNMPLDPPAAIDEEIAATVDDAAASRDD